MVPGDEKKVNKYEWYFNSLKLQNYESASFQFIVIVLRWFFYNLNFKNMHRNVYNILPKYLKLSGLLFVKPFGNLSELKFGNLSLGYSYQTSFLSLVFPVYQAH